ncbi:phosphate starvation-inducible protein PsiF [Acidovorax sp. SRB_14]|uniref:PsiF family protein n=1 Tax=unclassified Acidovorax TaxID=2684926 RepID=UPI00145E26FF|nr:MULTISPECIES: PsiF family protein [unclassified Acidovorax]NMM75341.1 phosphate starvation-inducible protein PsiF [Acidovorax sp. SRB_24]NMM81239.1 phosphate starvation-inducible protein PsiF [Acidovorax sp. SRB_14]NMM91480.1 phosphate starvation-inducible protein PsiF [Rhodococcus sp. SRB_17]
MKQLLSLTALGLALSLGAAHAADNATPSAQQSKMASCNTDAKGMKGDERKAFMKNCLSHKPATQQDKMKTCNTDAKGMKGDERKAFMAQCLKK